MGKKPTLNPRQALFVAEYIKTGNGTQSAIEAGYSKKVAAQISYELLHSCQAVMDAIEKHRKQAEKDSKYGYDKAMEECERCIKFAEKTENANAMAKAIELKAKLTGLMIEKHEHKVAGFNLQIVGLEQPREVTNTVPMLIGSEGSDGDT